MIFNRFALHRLTIVLVLIISIAFNLFSQKSKLYMGFGGGINFSFPKDIETITLYENLSGENQEEEYSNWIKNLGNQYFFQVDLRVNKFIFSITPGTYTNKYIKITSVYTGTDIINMETSQVLRYLNTPVTIKYFFPVGKLSPYLGITATYGLLLKQNETNNSIIKTKLTTGPEIGLYMDYNNFSIAFSTGYHFALHKITKMSDRYVNSSNLYSQSNMKLNDLYINASVLIPLEKSWRINSLQCNYP